MNYSTPRTTTSSPHFSPAAAMIAEDFGSVCVLATESIAGPTVEVACAHTGPKDRRGRGQRSLLSLEPTGQLRNHRICKEFSLWQ